MARTTTEEQARESAGTGDPAPSEATESPAAATPSEDAESPAEAAPGEDAEPEPSDDATEPETAARRRRVDPVLGVAVALVVIAAAVASYFGWSWYGAAHDDSLSYSQARDSVLRAGEQGVQNMNTLDYRNTDQGLAAWEDSSTGDLHQELVAGRDQFEAQVQQAKTVTTAKILDGAVTELDQRAGKAGIMVALQITVTPPKGQPTTKQSRMRAELTRTPSGWKLSALGQAPVGTSGNSG